MIKKHWKLLVITSIILVLPILVGVILWEQLPEQIPTHWNAAGEVDRWSSKTFAVFVLPLIMLAAQWLCCLGTGADPKKANHSDKVVHLVLWIIPVLQIVLFAITYCVALGQPVQMDVVMPALIGLIFAIIGNYLPKCKQNYTMGIKLPWTLASEANWNATHRFGGKVWVAGGILCLPCAFWGNFWVLMVILAAMVILPTVYSYLYYRKHKEDPANEQ